MKRWRSDRTNPPCRWSKRMTTKAKRVEVGKSRPYLCDSPMPLIRRKVRIARPVRFRGRRMAAKKVGPLVKECKTWSTSQMTPSWLRTRKVSRHTWARYGSSMTLRVAVNLVAKRSETCSKRQSRGASLSATKNLIKYLSSLTLSKVAKFRNQTCQQSLNTWKTENWNEYTYSYTFTHFWEP